MPQSSALAYVRPQGRPLGSYGREEARLSPRVKMAIRLYTSGAAKTKLEASTMAGLHPQTLTVYSNSPRYMEAINKYQNELSAMLDDESTDMQVILDKMARKAVGRIGELMYSSKDDVALKAAVDIADRSSKTQKVIRAQVETFSIAGEDAKALAAGMIEAARVRAANNAVVTGDFIKVELAERAEEPPE